MPRVKSPTTPPTSDPAVNIGKLLSEYAAVKRRVDKLWEEVNDLQEKYFKRRSRRIEKQLAEKQREYYKAYSELKKIEEKASRAVQDLVEKYIAPLHPSLRTLGKERGAGVLHRAWPVDKIRIGRTVINKPGIVIRAQQLEVYTLEELKRLFKELSALASRINTIIVLAVDSSPDHFPLVLVKRREIENLPNFLGEYNWNYVFIFNPE